MKTKVRSSLPSEFIRLQNINENPPTLPESLTSPTSTASLVRSTSASSPSPSAVLVASAPALEAGALLLLLRQGRQRLRRPPILADD